ncbi:hypothetical protein [Paenibacillus sp. MMS20-IR301]|uniref:hypothetical protein n=1 Tax=Paenibacillus sp. MMS20-IR301 TaxID=2895946 RepID=UPI0028E3E006|nr:hypothetical protein [Paenibacillus sp. MMS20-IR301]WNS44160.1 hypothetical protein LOS79_02510 [Paenibacillus sp. MMS20-IR301]
MSTPYRLSADKLTETGHMLIREVVPKFYALRFYYWRQELGSPGLQGASVHHQYIWDIRMMPGLYNIFAELLGNPCLWADFSDAQPAGLSGILAVNKARLELLNSERIPLTIEMNAGDLLVLDPQRLTILPEDELNWLNIQFIPAEEENGVEIMRRHRAFLQHQSRPVYLSGLGRRLLGTDKWQTLC